MEPKDRRFAEIAARLQLLTQEQLATCAQYLQGKRGKGIGEAAVDLGFLTSEQAERVQSAEARLAERQRGQTRKLPENPEPPGESTPRFDPRAAPIGVIEEHGPKFDPRSASGPPNPVDRRAGATRPGIAPSPAAIQRGRESPARREAGRVSVPPDQRERSGSGGRFPEPPTARVARQASVAEAEPTTAKPPPHPPPDSRQRQPATRPAAQATPAAAPTGGAWLDLEDKSAPPAPVAAGTEVAPRQAQPARDGAPVAPPAREVAPVAPQRAPSGPVSTHKRAATQAAPTSYLGRALTLALRNGASDLHVHSGAPIMIRVDGQLRPLSGNEALGAQAAEKVIGEMLNEAQKAQLNAKGELDFACELASVGRMRVNVYRQHRGLDAVFRLIPKDPPTLEQLGLPARLAKLTDFRTGMVLCTGPAGCGKSSTLAALLGGLAQSRADHILTIEDPVEFVFPPGKALVNQRQVRDHTSSFARALRAALREDPDIIVITELRDRDTISLAITAAETGHLVLGTLHTGSASQTISRIVNSFSADEQEQMRVMLSESLRAVVSQRLVPRAKGGGRVPAIELLMVNTAVSNLIREDKTHQLPSVMQTGKAAGMLTLDDSLDELLRAGTITVESARRFAVKKDRFV
jgi:twitching motility protein PilT